MAREYLKDINKLSDWLKYTANFDDEEGVSRGTIISFNTII